MFRKSVHSFHQAIIGSLDVSHGRLDIFMPREGLDVKRRYPHMGQIAAK
ncbi:MAG: hypothetical protein V1721_05545 [Pseudomonadota bacterium]